MNVMPLLSRQNPHLSPTSYLYLPACLLLVYLYLYLPACLPAYLPVSHQFKINH